jgi:hypothetical protein
MSIHIVFIRFFFNYLEDFPFERVAHLPDSEIETASYINGSLGAQ